MQYIRFVDDCFIINKNWVEKFCNLVQENHIKIKWQASCRIESVNSESIQYMKKAGCEVISLGIEFGNERIRSLTRKNFSNKDIIRAVSIIHDSDIKIYGLFMLGYPTETESTIKETIDMSIKLDLDMASFSIVTPYPGTELYEYCKKNNLLKTDNIEKYNTDITQPVFAHDNITAKKLGSFYVLARRKFYIRPRYFMKVLNNMNLTHSLYLALKMLTLLVRENVKILTHRYFS